MRAYNNFLAHWHSLTFLHSYMYLDVSITHAHTRACIPVCTYAQHTHARARVYTRACSQKISYIFAHAEQSTHTHFYKSCRYRFPASLHPKQTESGMCRVTYLLDSEAPRRGLRMNLGHLAGQRERRTMRTMMESARTAPMLLPMETGICQLVVLASMHFSKGEVLLRNMTTHTWTRETVRSRCLLDSKLCKRTRTSWSPS